MYFRKNASSRKSRKFCVSTTKPTVTQFHISWDYAIEKFFTTLKDFIHQDLVYLIPDRKATIDTTFFGSKVQKTTGSLSEEKKISQTTN